MKARRKSALRFCLAAALILKSAAWGPGVRSAPTGELSKFLTLDNGLKVFLVERRSAPLVNIAAAVNCGSKDDPAGASGTAHLLEHYVLFRGTNARSGDEIGRRVRSHGAFFNASTSQDLTLFEMSLPAAYADFGLATEREILFDLKIDPEGVEAEKAVLLEEVGQLADDPVRSGLGLVAQNIFGSHPYGSPLQGRKETLPTITADSLEAFYRSFFVPANCSLAVVGDLSLADMEEKVRAVFGRLASAPFEAKAVPPPAPMAKDLDITLEMDVNKAYCFLGMMGPDYQSDDQFPVDALTEIMGLGFNPMLIAALRVNRDLVETVSMGYTAFKHAGLIVATLTLEPKNLPAAKNEALAFLRRARKLDFGPEDLLGDAQFYAFDHLQSAKNQIRFRMYRSQEKGLNVAASLARYLILWDGTAERSYLKRIDALTTSDLRQAAGRYLGSGKKVVISIVPRKKGKNP